LTWLSPLLYIVYSMDGQELRRMRLKLKLTQAGLAEKLRMTATSVARMERGEQKIMFTTELAVRYLVLMQKQEKGEK
jgi:transcriptional regulator with XRE-family HTH domain